MHRPPPALVVLGALALGACRSPTTTPQTRELPEEGVAEPVLDAAQRRRIDAIVSVFENDTPTLQYDYVEALHDGRGLTAGRAGFTTGTGDLVAVVERYVAQVPDAAIGRFLPALRVHAAARSDDLADLAGLEDAWRAAASDARFRAAQDQIVEIEIWRPTLRHARALGVRTALGVLFLYDAMVQQGDGDDPDGVAATIARAEATAGGSPRDGVDEARWLGAFLEARRAVLSDAHDEATRAAWRASVARVDALRSLLDEGNFGLRAPIAVAPWGTRHVVL
jgi:chitosanase